MEVSDRSPVDILLRLGELQDSRVGPWLDYRQMGIGIDHIPDLIAIATNLCWINLADDHDPLGWAPIHAWRALGQLRADAAVDPLIRLFHEIDDNEWVIEELPYVLAEIGPAACPSLLAYLQDEGYPPFARMIAATSLAQLGVRFPAVRQEVVDVLCAQLERYRKNTSGVNSILISRLVDLDARECSELIHEVFVASKVDRFITGDWRDIKKRLVRA